MNKMQKKHVAKLLRFFVLAMFVLGIMNERIVVNAANKPLIHVSLVEDSTKSHRLYVGMQWSPAVHYEYGEEDGDDNVWVRESAGTLKGVTFSSSNPKVASVDKNGIVKAKKAGTAKITIKSAELNKTIKVKVLQIKKVNKKKLVKEVIRKSDEFDWPLINTYEKKDKDVKNGIVKAKKKYNLSLYSIRKYKQPNGKYRYVFAYQVFDKKGKLVKKAQMIEVPVEEVMIYWGLCSNFDSVQTVAGAVKENHCDLAWQTYPYPNNKKDLKQVRAYARENIYSSKNAYYSATYKYGWRNMCWR